MQANYFKYNFCNWNFTKNNAKEKLMQKGLYY